MSIEAWKPVDYIHGLVQDCSNSIANALESCTKHRYVYISNITYWSVSVFFALTHRYTMPMKSAEGQTRNSKKTPHTSPYWRKMTLLYISFLAWNLQFFKEIFIFIFFEILWLDTMANRDLVFIAIPKRAIYVDNPAILMACLFSFQDCTGIGCCVPIPDESNQ